MSANTDTTMNKSHKFHEKAFGSLMELHHTATLIQLPQPLQPFPSWARALHAP